MSSSLSATPSIAQRPTTTTDTTVAPKNPHAVRVIGLSPFSGPHFGEFITDYGSPEINSIMQKVNDTLLPYTKRSEDRNVAELWPKICKLSGQTFAQLPDTPLPPSLWQIVAGYAQADFFQCLDEQRGPVLKDMDHSPVQLNQFQQQLEADSVIKFIANYSIPFLTKYNNAKLYHFFTSAYFLNSIADLDLTQRQKSVGTNSEGNWPLVASTLPIPGENAQESDKCFADAFFTTETVTTALQIRASRHSNRDKAIEEATQILQKCLGTEALVTKEDVDFFSTTLGLTTGYFYKERMNRQLLWEAGLIPEVNKAKAFFTATLNNPEFAARQYMQKILQSDVAFLQSCDPLLKNSIEKAGYSSCSSGPRSPFIVTNPTIWRCLIRVQHDADGYDENDITAVLATHLPTATEAILMAARFSRIEPLTTAFARMRIKLERLQGDYPNPIKLIAAIEGITLNRREEFLKEVSQRGWKTTTPDPNWITQRALSLQFDKIGVPRPAETTYFITNDSEFTQPPGSAKPIYFPNMEAPSGHAPMSATTFMRVKSPKNSLGRRIFVNS